MFRNKERIIKRTFNSRHYTNIEDYSCDTAVELSLIDDGVGDGVGDDVGDDVDDDAVQHDMSFPIINDIEHMDVSTFEKNEV